MYHQYAQMMLSQFHLIVHSERLFYDIEYVKQIEQFFGNHRGLIGKNSRMFCGEESSKANAALPLTLKDEWIQQAVEMNQPDIALYRYFTETLCHSNYSSQHEQQSNDDVIDNMRNVDDTTTTKDMGHVPLSYEIHFPKYTLSDFIDPKSENFAQQEKVQKISTNRPPRGGKMKNETTYNNNKRNGKKQTI